MKKMIYSSLLTVGLLSSGVVSVFADETTVPVDPVTPPAETIGTSTTDSSIPEEPPVDPVTPPSELTEPVTPDPELPEPSTSEPIGGGEVPRTTPIDPGTTPTETPSTAETPGSTTTDPSTTEQPTTPSTSEEPEQPTEESTQPSEEQPKEEPKEDKDTQSKEDKPAAPAKEVTVSVDASGKITTGTSQGTSVPIVTSDVKEISHVPTPTTPLKTATGQTIVGVKDGVPLVQDTQGNLVEDPSIPVKKLPSGNIEVKTADGKTKVLPKTGEEVQAALSILGVLLIGIAGFFGYKKRKS
ncbi:MULTISPECIES: LPXTG cell wall anchor domain-containing protein [Enterococcus]|uniref:LPXTG cell wall anchor domain-containing protein n=1 Tax=Enterococcus TaxID=1350 RepID=UPI0014747D5A|nr:MULTISPECIES: LPXTG cell wall anchor domain-containing protein [Enterococcus]MBE6170502.1 LPXTG cell wall anchor domain-containing protein [Enterococcus casseliflavus]MCI5685619.1 LPXTG cell wall anchor domain-containing protein [Enterococcus gallinarum]MCO5478298.1 LPXTG cell wall anchor domain-containing protein [Enterococcus gallinarum]MDN6949223.1 LPXTG cell wall anchor domain-containing protein [Enterococcus faecium]MDV7822113.1 LPXTG cell wall anchor domain-containing protein [Enteroc